MRYNVLKITTIHAILIACATLAMVACPEPEKPTAKPPAKTKNKADTPSFIVSFHPNGGTGNIPSLAVSKGKPAAQPKNNPTYPDPKNPTKAKHTFGLWYWDKARKTPFFFDTPITTNTTLYAGWNKPGHYTVRFNTNGLSATNIIGEQIVALGKTVKYLPPPPPPPEKIARTFGLWYTDKALTTLFKFYTKITENTTLYAGWNKPTTDTTSKTDTTSFSVTFDTKGGTAIPEQTIKEGANVTMPAAPEKTDLTFGGWYRDKALTTPFKFATKITTNTIIYARWNGFDHYTVTFDTRGGTAIPARQVRNGSIIPKPTPAPEKPNFTFGGWYRDKALTTPFKFATKITTNTIIYARWNKYEHYTVVFDTNGGSAIPARQILKESKVPKPTKPPTKTDLTFGLWYTNRALTTPFKFATTPITANTTIYAGWKATVTFGTNGGTPAINEQTIKEGDKATKPKNPEKLKYTFVGWYTDKTLNLPFKFDTDTITEHITLYAKWNKRGEFNVRFNTRGIYTVAEQTIKVGTKATQPSNPSYRYDYRSGNYVFDLWYRDKALNTPFDFDTETITEDITLYAGWKITVRFDTEGGSAIPKQTIKVGDKATEPKKPEKLKYTFFNWYKDAALKRPFNFDTLFTEPTIIYAGWQATVRFDTRGGTPVDEQLVLIGRHFKEPEKPTKTGFVFDEWHYESHDNTLRPFNLRWGGIINRNRTLYAVWHTVVTFDTRGGSAVAEQTIKVGTKATMPPNPSYYGISFDGWYREKEPTTPFNFDTLITEPTIIYARWKVTVTFEILDGTKPIKRIIEKGTKFVFTPGAPGRKGAIFDKWHKDKELTTPFDFDTPITEPTIIYARWKVTVRFNTNGGTPKYIDSQTIKKGDKVGRPENPTKTGFAFGGWYTGSASGPLFDFDTDKIYKHITLYAGWRYLWKAITTGGNLDQSVVGITEGGELWTTGMRNGSYRRFGTALWKAVAAGPNHTVGIDTYGRLYAWGESYKGQLGLGGDTYERTRPTQVDSDRWRWTAVAAGRGHTVGIKKNGSLWAWGWNSLGQLGIGSSGAKRKATRPMKVGDDKWRMVAAGSSLTVGIKKNGSLWAWGNNYYGQLGNGKSGLDSSGNGEKETRPVKVGDDKWRMAAAGWRHTVGIKADGTLWTWGENKYGQLGNGKSGEDEKEARPVKVGTATWKAVAAGGYHTVGIKADGSLWAWGENKYGQLGNGKSGEDEKEARPVKVGDDKWRMVAAGDYHTVGIKKDGTLWAWGYNGNDQLGKHRNSGDGEKETRPVKVQDWNK